MAAGDVKWTYTGAGSKIETTPCLGPDGTVYFTEVYNGNKWHAVNPDGTQKWTNTVSGTLVDDNFRGHYLVYWDGGVHGGTRTNKVVKRDPDTGVNLASATYESDSSNTVDDGGPAFRPSGSVVYAPDGSPGSIRSFSSGYSAEWEYTWNTQNNPDTSVAIDSAGVSYVKGTGETTALDSSGNSIWSKSNGTTGGGAPAITEAEDLVFLASSDGIEAVDPADGSTQWTKGNGFVGSILVNQDDTKLWFTEGGSTYCVEPYTGNTIWSFGQGGEGGLGVAADEGAYIHAGGTVYGVDPDGNQRWSTSLDNSNDRSGIVVDGSRNVLYTGTGAGTFYAIEVEQGALRGSGDSGFPWYADKFRGLAGGGFSYSDLVYEEGQRAKVGTAGENQFEYDEGEDLYDNGESSFVFIQDTGMGRES
ncbi:beta-propeller repeat protein [Haloarcula californiae tailed virus 2]|uniref:Pyrrolo-quinoline quinone repeat domain-containing protein n=1 Tax=Haloarcula californiae tailed virus 2 TaxID=1273747 RepID=R4T7S6_9CAUD|nr:beta-propeller repeat protein [Haloarcula californiae tailed virus 2]AGM11829.1 hypothetical protein HCTV2_60 [Haloarcula californiae tailed virus 2]